VPLLPKRTRVRTIITTNKSRTNIASLYVPTSWELTSEMKAWLWPRPDIHKLSPAWAYIKGFVALNLAAAEPKQDGHSLLFVWVWTRIWCVIFKFPRFSSGPTNLSILYRRRHFPVIVIVRKYGPVAFHQSPPNVMPHLFSCIVAHSYYMTHATVCCILAVSYRWEWTVRHTNCSYGNGNLTRQKR
jgi:hypothetical protein